MHPSMPNASDLRAWNDGSLHIIQILKKFFSISDIDVSLEQLERLEKLAAEAKPIGERNPFAGDVLPPMP